MIGICVVIGLTLNCLLKINITSLIDLVLKAIYSVIPLYFPLRKVVLEIGPLIKANELTLLTNLSPISNDFLIYEFFFIVVNFLKSRGMSIICILFLLRFFCLSNF